MNTNEENAQPLTTDPDLLVDMRDVEFVRGGRTLVGPVTWQVELDERWVVIGPNGAGKTTLIRMASAQEFPSAGTVFILGERVGATDMRDLRAAIGVTSSAVAQRVPDDEKVGDLVVSAGYAILGRWREDYDEMDYEQALEVLEQVGAIHLMDRRWGTLSDGEKKRVLVARAVMTNPELLILDEPAAGMDLGGREDLMDATRARVRTPPGHPEGYIEAFANLYAGFAEAIRARAEGRAPGAVADGVPTARDGLKGVAFIEAVVDCHEASTFGWVGPRFT